MNTPFTTKIHTINPGPATAPVDCSFPVVTSSSAWIFCYEDFDGGSLPNYRLQRAAHGGTTFDTLQNSDVPEFEMYGLNHLSSYSVRICANNKDYSDNYACTETHNFTTLNGKVN